MKNQLAQINADVIRKHETANASSVKSLRDHAASQNREQVLASELLRDLADGKGWDSERWAKRGLQASDAPEAPRTLFANPKYPGNWKDHHDLAIIKPREGFESAMVQMLKGWTEYAETVKAKYDSLIGNDYVLGPEWEAIGKGIEGLLNGECGRIDCGTIDGYIRDSLKANDCEVED